MLNSNLLLSTAADAHHRDSLDRRGECFVLVGVDVELVEQVNEQENLWLFHNS